MRVGPLLFETPILELKSKLLKGGLYRGLYMGVTIRDIKGDTRSLDYSSYRSKGLGRLR